MNSDSFNFQQLSLFTANVTNHIVVVWQGQVLDYESEIIYMLTEDLLHQMCGVNTTFSHISYGCGLFPSKSI
jgi:hypothetical protein